MTTLSSRPTNADTLGDLRDLIENSNVEILIVEDRTIDPPVMKIKAMDKLNSELLIMKHADEKFSLFDVIRLLDKLGYVADYEERK